MRDLLTRAIGFSAVKGIRLEQDAARLRAYDERLVRADISVLQKLTGWRPQPDMGHLIQLLLDYWRVEIAFRYPESTAQLPRRLQPPDGHGSKRMEL